MAVEIHINLFFGVFLMAFLFWQRYFTLQHWTECLGNKAGIRAQWEMKGAECPGSRMNLQAASHPSSPSSPGITWDARRKLKTPEFSFCLQKKIKSREKYRSRATPFSDQFFPDKFSMNKTILLAWKEEREGNELDRIQ